MNPHSFDQPTTFRVTIGHAEVRVTCSKSDDVIALARKRLSLEMPRMWDLIYRVEDRDFHVERLR